MAGTRRPRAVRGRDRLGTCSADAEAPREISHAAGQRVEVGYVAAGGHMIHHLGQELGEAASGLLLAEARLAGNLLEPLRPEDLRHGVGRDRLVRARAHPGCGLLAEARALKLHEHGPEPARGAAAAGGSAQHLAEDVAEAAGPA